MNLEIILSSFTGTFLCFVAVGALCYFAFREPDLPPNVDRDRRDQL